MTRIGADAESTSVSELKSLGATFVCRYFSPAPNSKNLTLSEANTLKAGGIDIVSNWELDTNDWEGGHSQGVSFAQQAASEHTACGGPGAAPIYFSVDMDADPTSVVNSSYFQGINSVIGAARTGAYAGTAVLRALKAAGLIQWTWRTMSTDFQGGAGNPGEFNIDQTGYFNSNYDRDVANTVNFGQWSANGGSGGGGGTVNYQYNATHNTYTPLTVDGQFGPNSTKALQFVVGVTPDGNLGSGSITALQVMLGNYNGTALAHDGVLGATTIKAVQQRSGASQTGTWNRSVAGDPTSTAVQKALNAGTFWGHN